MQQLLTTAQAAPLVRGRRSSETKRGRPAAVRALLGNDKGLRPAARCTSPRVMSPAPWSRAGRC